MGGLTLRSRGMESIPALPVCGLRVNTMMVSVRATRWPGRASTPISRTVVRSIAAGWSSVTPLLTGWNSVPEAVSTVSPVSATGRTSLGSDNGAISGACAAADWPQERNI